MANEVIDPTFENGSGLWFANTCGPSSYVTKPAYHSPYYCCRLSALYNNSASCGFATVTQSNIDTRCSTTLTFDVINESWNSTYSSFYYYVNGNEYRIYPGSSWANISHTLLAGEKLENCSIIFRSQSSNSSYTTTVCVTNVTINSTKTAPTASFTTTSDPMKGDAPFSVTFTDESTTGCPPPTYLWEYGDGETASTSGNKTHIYSAGLYTADLTLSNSAGSDGDTVDVYAWGVPSSVSVIGLPMVEISTAYTYSVVIAGGYADSYEYDWTITGDGVTGADYSIDDNTIANPEISFDSNKVFTVSCSVSSFNDTPTEIGSAVVGSLDVYIGTAPDASRMKEDFCMIVGDKILRIR